jgi:CubicO group peptidase (beta-lactamase class C family)
MSTAVLEPDASGTFLAPAFIYASARDWARFGLFILKDGVWKDKRILPEGWISYSTRPTEASAGHYGAHFWRRVPGFLRPDTAAEWPLPDDRFYMLGHDGQMVAMVPSRQLVVVRLGLSRRRGAWDPDELLYAVLQALRGTGSGSLPGSAESQVDRGFSWGRADRPERQGSPP